MKKVLEAIIRILFNFLDFFFQKKTYIVFSTRSAKDYADNSKVLFEEFLSNNATNVFFYTKKKSVLLKIPENGLYAYSFKAIYILLKSKVLIFTHGSKDFFPYTPKKHPKRTFINLFHAIAVKKIGDVNFSNQKKEVDLWDYFLVSSHFEANFIKKQFGLTDQNMLVFGQPRNDILVINSQSSEKRSKMLILYAPTFRDFSDTKLFPFEDKDLDLLDSFLSENNMEIVIRLHINDENRYKKSVLYSNLKNIHFSGSKETPSVNDILHTFDLLISDYSSIVLDYLLLNKPVIYLPYDYDEYKQVRGFSFDFHKHRAGPIANTQKELILFLSKNEDKYRKKRLELTHLFHKYQDGKSSKRLYNFINKL